MTERKASTDITEREASTMLLPTYALRAWLTALLGQLERARSDIDARVEYHEKEIARLQAQMQRSNTVITALNEAIGSVDNVLRRTRDTDVKSESGQSRTEAQEQAQMSKKLAAAPSDKPQPTERGKS